MAMVISVACKKYVISILYSCGNNSSGILRHLVGASKRTEGTNYANMCFSTLRRLAENGRNWQLYSFLPELLMLLIIKIRPTYDYYY